ncbi:dynein light chain Tctex-type 5-like isoform X2 [Venturia canescens]|uniref:dynein light chain Tctex-type 5-like isoform X2 n=1 Tax=Venturia canescens TaxID=32260 RepID=UPI001C9CE8AB|nr:dynein light chain Tctex-type 5-like isoform X2 [Venturia canescens]
MSIKSTSRLSTTHVSDSSRPSLQRSAKPGGLNVKPFAGSVASLLWPGRASAVFRTDKTGYKVPRYQNSYRLGSYNPFNCEAVENILDDVMKNLSGIKYNPAVCMKLCQDMSAEVRSRIHKKDYDRYKYIVRFTIFEKLGQAIYMATDRLCDVERDTHCSRTFESTELICVGTVYGIYFE